MNRFFLLIAAGCLFVLLAISCGSKKKDSETKGPYDEYEVAQPEDQSSDATASDPYAEGKALVESNDCKTCHHKTNKIIGPSHTEVAKKYEFTEANVKMLAGKIINGGSGVWGDIQMTPHPNLSEADAEKISRYILSLDGEKEH